MTFAQQPVDKTDGWEDPIEKVTLIKDDSTDPENKFWITKKNSRWGLITENGKMIIPHQYESIEWQGDYAITKRYGKVGVINREGRIVIPNEYEAIERFEGGANGTENGVQREREIH